MLSKAGVFTSSSLSDEHEVFRRIAAHLQQLYDSRQLLVRSLVFEEPLITDFKGVPRAEDINNGFKM